MGCGTSSPFNKTPVEEQLPLTLGESGRIVHVVGTVAPADGKVLSSPFGRHQGVAMRVSARRQLGGISLFKVQSALDFYIADATTRIRVLVPDVESWAWQLQCTHAAHNIMVDAGPDVEWSMESAVMLSGGERYEQSKIEVRPDALQFWDRLNGGRDPVAAIQRINGPGFEDLQRPREATEHTLRLGDAVAIVGMLAHGADELTLSAVLPTGQGMISNDPACARSLCEVRVGDSGSGTGELRVVPLGRHKGAKSYAGSRW